MTSLKDDAEWNICFDFKREEFMPKAGMAFPPPTGEKTSRKSTSAGRVQHSESRGGCASWTASSWGGWESLPAGCSPPNVVMWGGDIPMMQPPSLELLYRSMPAALDVGPYTGDARRADSGKAVSSGKGSYREYNYGGGRQRGFPQPPPPPPPGGGWDAESAPSRNVGAHQHEELRERERKVKVEKEAPLDAKSSVDAAIEAFVANVSGPLQKADFDTRARNFLANLQVVGGDAKVLEYLNFVASSTAQKARPSINSWPAYVLALLKKYQQPAGTPTTKQEGKEMARREPREPRPPVPESQSWAALDQETRQAEAAAAAAPAAEPVAEEVDDWPVRKALRQGKIAEALDLVATLPEISIRLARRVLAALGKTSTFSEEVIDKLMELAGRFQPDALEAEALEAEQRGEASSCRQLYQVAGLMSITKTSAALQSLIQGLVAEPDDRAKSMVDEVVLDSSITFTLGLAGALVAVCVATKDQELFNSVKERAQAEGVSITTPEEFR